MLKRLLVKNFTVFAEADFEFGLGLNVVVGTNGTGKSHVLKVGYAVMRAASEPQQKPIAKDSQTYWSDTLRNTFHGVFLPEALHDLTRRALPEADAVVEVKLNEPLQHVSFRIPFFPDFHTDPTDPDLVSFDELKLTAFPKERVGSTKPLFIPAKEVLSMFNGFLALYENREIDFDLTYPDLCRQLSLPNLKEPKYKAIMTALQTVMGGAVRLNGRRFVFEPTGKQHPLSINLYAEGLRKFGILWQLLQNGSLTPETTLFWDEPEANLNPVLLKKLAAVLTDLASQGFQIILATHSLFLLKELHVLAQQQKSKVRYFGLYSSPAGDTRVEQTDDLETLNHLAALDEELAQTARFQRVLDEDFVQSESQLPE